MLHAASNMLFMDSSHVWEQNLWGHVFSSIGFWVHRMNFIVWKFRYDYGLLEFFFISDYRKFYRPILNESSHVRGSFDRTQNYWKAQSPILQTFIIPNWTRSPYGLELIHDQIIMWSGSMLLYPSKPAISAPRNFSIRLNKCWRVGKHDFSRAWR